MQFPLPTTILDNLTRWEADRFQTNEVIRSEMKSFVEIIITQEANIPPQLSPFIDFRGLSH